MLPGSAKVSGQSHVPILINGWGGVAFECNHAEGSLVLRVLMWCGGAGGCVESQSRFGREFGSGGGGLMVWRCGDWWGWGIGRADLRNGRSKHKHSCIRERTAAAFWGVVAVALGHGVGRGWFGLVRVVRSGGGGGIWSFMLLFDDEEGYGVGGRWKCRGSFFLKGPGYLGVRVWLCFCSGGIGGMLF